MHATTLIAVLMVLLALGLGAAPRAAEAQQSTKVPRMGYLTATSLSVNAARVDAFRQGLRERGYVEGKNISIEWRSAEGKSERVPELASELVRLEVEVIVTAGSPATRAAKHATLTIPIVMAQDSDPVGNGFIGSLARPGGNITGLSTLAPEISGKQLELLKEIVPRFSRVAVLGTSTRPGNAQSLRATELVAAAFRVKVQYLDVLGPEAIDTVFREADKGRADAVLVLPSFVLNSHRKELIELAAKRRLPAIYDRQEFVEDGGLMSYSVSSIDLFRRAAVYVDKILKGAKPAELPVEQPTKFEFVINMKTAKAQGVTISDNLLSLADEVIE